MSDSQNTTQKNTKRTLFVSASLFLFCVIIISLLVPREAKFPYEIQKGDVWHYDDYFAPFDYPILKTKAEIAEERDSLEQTFEHYYQFNESAWKENRILVEERFGEEVAAALDTVYNIGVMDWDQRNNMAEFWLVRNNVHEIRIFREFKRPTEVYEEMHRRFDCTVELNQLLIANIVYDTQLSEKMQAEKLSRVNYATGVVSKGKLIITRGEVISEDAFRSLNSCKEEFEKRIGASDFGEIFFGKILLVLVCFALLFAWFATFRLDILKSPKMLTFVLFNVVSLVAASCIIMRFDICHLYVLPFAALPIIISTFMDARAALYMHLLTMVLVGSLYTDSFEFLFLNISTGIMGVVMSKSFYHRGGLFKGVLMILVTYSLVYTIFVMLRGLSFRQIEWMNYVYFAISSVLILLVYPSIYLIEKVFNFVSDIRLMELTDTNRALLRELSEKATGTFQHTLQVAHLCERVAQKIGGNPLLIRVGALYHDIGKMDNAVFFTENQGQIGYNPHDELPPEESSRIIVGHILRGVEMAENAGLPPKVINFIRSHHGDGSTRYFWEQYKREHGLDESSPEKQKFCYPGPKPQSKEEVILMMCDSIEAASRSLKETNQENISALVENIVAYQEKSGMYAAADITYREVMEAKEVIKQRLMGIYHVRIAYPKAEN